MDVKEFGLAVAKLGLPLLGAALPVPGGAAIGTALAAAIGANSSSQEDVLKTLTENSDALEKARQFEATHQETMLKITTDAEIRSIEAVNKTMQAEAASDHWPTYGWRPYIGFISGTVILWNYCLAQVFGKEPVAIDAQVWLFLTAVLGVASYFRGKMQASPDVKTDNRG